MDKNPIHKHFDIHILESLRTVLKKDIRKVFREWKDQNKGTPIPIDRQVRYRNNDYIY